MASKSELSPLPDALRDALLEPADAVEYWRAKRRLSLTFDYAELWEAEHARQFTMAKVLRLDVLSTIHDGIGHAIKNGQTLREFRNGMRPLLEAKGFWGKQEVTDPRSGEVAKIDVPSRLALTYDANLRTSYSAGRWARIERNKDILPFLVYRTMGDALVRPLHAAWEGTALLVDDPWWDEHYTPNGYRCRCRVYATDAAGVAALGKSAPIRTEAPPTEYFEWEDRATGHRSRVPAGIDPGWAYHPGKAASRATAETEFLRRKLSAAPPALARATAADLLADGVNVPTVGDVADDEGNA
ncbi:phage head morphogenesis protein [Pandoraea fibrosis]|uniref:Phage head morphogenesis protein n=1 Tax=Pandoraea fibrosis TaxID=1891094 RepID=A0A5E4XG14_9BURK|nr:phage minor head protein [Pandoraea fibrosis]VVE35324.1 phage head morphogenesis protein [Pandoraea fibrosis]